MNSFESNFDRLQRSFTKAMLVHILFSTAVMPLLVLYVAGQLFFLVFWDEPTLAVVWMALIAGITAGALGTALFNQSLRRAVLTSLLGKVLQVEKLRNDRLRRAAWSALESFVGIATNASWGMKISSADIAHSRLIANLYDLLGLHLEAELTGDLPDEERRGLADEVQRLLRSAQSLVSESTLGGLSKPRRIRDLLEQSEARLASVLASWPNQGRRDKAMVDGDGLKGDSFTQELDLGLAERRFSLKSSFEQFSYQPGREALERLDSQYAKLLGVLGRRRYSDPLVVAEIPVLAEEAYGQALSVLEDCVDLVQATNAPDRERLERESRELEGEIAALAISGDTSTRTALRSERLQSRRDRLRAMEKQELSIEQLLNECERCETCLDRTCLELASLKGESAALAVTAVTETLRRTVERARSVQDELKHLTS